MGIQVSLQNLLMSAARKCGLDPLQISQGLADNFADWLQDRVARAWIRSTWPDTLNLDQRQYAPSWTAQSYSSGAIVFYAAVPGYYQANGNVTSGQVPGMDPAWVGVAPARTLPFVMTGWVTIEEPLNVWADDPRVCRSPRRIAWWRDASNIYVDARPSCAQPFVQYRTVAPVFSAEPLNVAGVLTAGTLGLWYGLPYPNATGDGNCYVVNAGGTNANDTPASAPSKFAIQQCPQVLSEYAKRGAKADWFSDDGQEDKAAAAETSAEGWLNDRLADLTILQGQTANYRGSSN